MSESTVEKPVALLFSGQGNPVIGMGADLWGLNPTTKNIWDCACDISGMDIRRICLKGPMNRLIQTTVQQLAVTAINVTLFTLCREKLEADRIIGSCGHSVGEYSALYAAGAVSLETLFQMIHFRANVMNDMSQMNKGHMLAVKGIDNLRLRSLISHSGASIDISSDNSRKQQVVGGASGPLSEFSRTLLDAGFESDKLGVSGAWHTRLMAEGVLLMKDFLAGIEIARPQHDVLMNVTGKAEYCPEQIKENLALHLIHTVKWTDSMEQLLIHEPPVRFVEIGNKAYLGQMLNDYIGFVPDMLTHCKTLLSH